MKQIPLTQDKFALVSDHRFDYLNQFEWQATFDGYNWYAQRTEGEKTIKMHREIMGVTDPFIFIDHRDNNGLNNQDENLRECTNAENQRKRGKAYNNKSGYKGVSFDKKKYRYRAQIRHGGDPVFLGHFENPKDAALAYNEAAKKYHGEFAYLNPVNFQEELVATQ
jgi:hypothetical protein